MSATSWSYCRPSLSIQRLTGDGERESLIGPMWSLKKLVVMNEIDKELARRDSWQGQALLSSSCF